MTTVHLRSRRSGKDLRDVVSPRARAKRSDNSTRVCLTRLIAELNRSRANPDVLCSWNSLRKVLAAANDWADLLSEDQGADFKRKTYRLRRSIRTIAQWMQQAKQNADAQSVEGGD